MDWKAHIEKSMLKKSKILNSKFHNLPEGIIKKD